MSQWWFCLVHQRVEGEDGCANAERLGPFDTEDQAAHALQLARERNEQWDHDEDEWNGKPPAKD